MDLNCQSKLTKVPLGIIAAPVSATQKLQRYLVSDGEKRGAYEQWQVVVDSLTNPESEGLITTSLTRAFHALFLNKPSVHMLVPKISLTDIRWPDPKIYEEQILRFVVGQRLTIEQLSQDLVARGYTRHRQTLEANSFRTRGETIEISHSEIPGIISLTLYGNTLENIHTEIDRRQQRLHRISVPSVKLPKPTLSSDEFLKLVTHEEVEIPPFFLSSEPNSEETSPVSRQRALELLGQLEEGSPAVHADHGIGIYEGLQVKHVGDSEQEYLVLQYAEGDALFVPVTYAHKVTAYVGDHSPKLHRLGGTVWLKSKRRAKEEAAAFAKELLKVAGQRSLANRDPYQLSPRVETALNESFPFELTPDQVQTWEEVKTDLTKPQPTDRVIVGDVGFGKTEIAIRAGRHVAETGRQVAILAPTTLLVQQHFDTFCQRLPEMTDKIALLSRFTTTRHVRQVHRDIENGKVQIVIGTHALLSKHIHWKSLGLVIIDEEQKFGVRHKEHFKKLRASVDVISLSATPIPRTLAFALSGLRDLSLIQTAPVGRLNVETIVAPRGEKLLTKAIQTELTRGGQTYVVASKIRQLAAIKEHISALVPKARVAIAHGRLPGRDLEKIMHAFDTGEIDVLVSSNIVENGLDLPRANTILIWNAPDFGLSDLYQLRGRVGRRSEQGYAYLMYQQAELTSEQRSRLAAITEASRLGAGWSVARRDLEIRGTGNLLGKEQSGTANEVGVQLYVDLINQAAQDLSLQEPIPTSEKPEEKKPITISEETKVELPLTALLPTTYLPNTLDRAKWYQRLSRANSPEALVSLAQELEKEFGTLPTPAQNLILLLHLQRVAQKSKLTKIDSKKISPPEEDQFFRVTLHSKTNTVLETPEITPAFVQELITTLSR